MRYGLGLEPSVAPPLQPSALEAVDVKALVLVLVAVALLAFGSGGLFTPAPVTDSHPPLPPPHVTPPSRDTLAEDAVDAYGNEITNAVAEYTLDGAGTLYELHSPQVELPRLGSPES
jgi:hypothetical protein